MGSEEPDGAGAQAEGAPRAAAGDERRVRGRLYLELVSRLRAQPGAQVTVGDLAAMEGPAAVVKSLQDLAVAAATPEPGGIGTVSALRLVRMIKDTWPQLDVTLLGGPSVIVESVAPRRGRPLRVVLVGLLLFLGSATAILHFHADIGMVSVHQEVYRLVTGQEHEQPLILQIPYSLGIGLGILLFFNRLTRRGVEEPSPLELEVYLYERNLDRLRADRSQRLPRQEPPDLPFLDDQA